MLQKNLGCLVIHGFGGGYHEVKPLVSFLENKGYYVVCPILKGHTGNRQDMKTATYEDWIESAEEKLKELSQKCSEIAIIGFSMGGLIAVNLALKYDIKAMVTINTPIYYWDLKRVFLNLLDDIKNKNLNNFNRYIRARKISPNIALYNFLKLLNKTKLKFNNINCPFFIIQAKDDDTVRYKSAEFIYNNLSSDIKEKKYYEKGGHLLLISKTGEQVILDVYNFINRI